VSFRRFTDRDKQDWEIRPQSSSVWELSPTGENSGKPRTVPAPGYEKDPWEMSQEELQRLLDASVAAPERKRKNPFGDA
jgi:hypothetical protein